MPHSSKLIPLQSKADWREQLRKVITDGTSLLQQLDLSPSQVNLSDAACQSFSLKVPLAFVQRMRKGDPNDPLLKQVLASADELINPADFGPDPTGESKGVIPRAGIIHKYQGRLLLVVTGGCAINCRYCFRRHFPYSDNINSRQQWREALAYIAEDPSITEVILSGGDPLVADDDYLAELCEQIAAIAHVKRLRIHSRLPIVLPDRITHSLLDAICPKGLQSVMVVHCNHANEIDADVGRAIAVMRERQMTVLNQSVLLAGVNDSSEALVALSEKLFANGVLPYYLHLLDKVQGAAHFDLAEQRAQELHAAITRELPGYLVPKLVREIAGEAAKTAIPALTGSKS